MISGYEIFGWLIPLPPGQCWPVPGWSWDLARASLELGFGPLQPGVGFRAHFGGAAQKVSLAGMGERCRAEPGETQTPAELHRLHTCDFE